MAKLDAGVGRVTIGSDRPSIEVNTLLGGEVSVVTDGYGGWEVIGRPKRVGLTQWTGRNPIAMEVPILLDEWANNEGSVEPEIRNLERMATVSEGDDEPPKVTIVGPVPHTNYTWVISNITWGAGIVNRNGYRTRQEATISLLQYIKPDQIVIKASSLRKRERAQAARNDPSPGKGSGAVAIYTVVTGDTLSKIAARELGSAARWKEIAQMNGIRDPNSLRLGQKIRVPK